MDKREARVLVSRAIMTHPEGISDEDICRWAFVESAPLFEAMRDLEREGITARKLGTDSSGFAVFLHVWAKR